MIEQIQSHFLKSFGMLVKLIQACPDDLWDQKHGGFFYWQQLLHAFNGNLYWTQLAVGQFREPFMERKLYPELDGEPEGRVSKTEMMGIAASVAAQNAEFLANRSDSWLMEPCVVHNGILNIDVTLMQIRHIQYHVGHCDCILRENNCPAVEWVD